MYKKLNVSGIYLREEYYTKNHVNDEESYVKPQKSLIEQTDLKQTKDDILEKEDNNK